jgi:hypothetical protein
MNYISKTIDEFEFANQDLTNSIFVLGSMTSGKSSHTSKTCAKPDVIIFNEEFKMINPDLLNRRRNALANIWSFELTRCQTILF